MVHNWLADVIVFTVSLFFLCICYTRPMSVVRILLTRGRDRRGFQKRPSLQRASPVLLDLAVLVPITAPLGYKITTDTMLVCLCARACARACA